MEWYFQLQVDGSISRQERYLSFFFLEWYLWVDGSISRQVRYLSFFFLLISRLKRYLCFFFQSNQLWVGIQRFSLIATNTFSSRNMFLPMEQYLQVESQSNLFSSMERFSSRNLFSSMEQYLQVESRSNLFSSIERYLQVDSVLIQEYIVGNKLTLLLPEEEYFLQITCFKYLYIWSWW